MKNWPLIPVIRRNVSDVDRNERWVIEPGIKDRSNLIVRSNSGSNKVACIVSPAKSSKVHSLTKQSDSSRTVGTNQTDSSLNSQRD